MECESRAVCGALVLCKPGKCLNKNVSQRIPATMSDDELRAEWRENGGSFHGPIVEHVSMSEADYFKFRRSL